jgi:hypothetical protein
MVLALVQCNMAFRTFEKNIDGLERSLYFWKMTDDELEQNRHFKLVTRLRPLDSWFMLNTWMRELILLPQTRNLTAGYFG